MKQLGEIELERARILKAARSYIRLKHSLAADAELNERLPEIEKAMDKAIHSGKEFVLDVRSMLEDE